MPGGPRGDGGTLRRFRAWRKTGGNRRRKNGACGGRPEEVLPLELRHGAPVAFGHVAHAQAGVFPFLDGNGIIKPLPQQAVTGLRLVRRGHLEGRQGPDNRLAGDVEQGLPVGAVIKEETLVVKPGGEVSPQRRENPVFWLDFAPQHASQV